MGEVGDQRARRIVRALSAVIRYALMATLIVPFAVGCYALWDSQQVTVRAAHDLWQPYKPTEPEPLSFWELQRINPEVRAWLEVYGTNIDYPVCQATSETWEKYLTHDAVGNYSLSGALFMDDNNASNFSDFGTIVYGHHMDQEVMFGPITDFADKAFFEEHRYGDLFFGDVNHGLEFFSYFEADAYDRSVYRIVGQDEGDQKDYLMRLHELSLWWRDDVSVESDDRIVLLSN